MRPLRRTARGRRGGEPSRPPAARPLLRSTRPRRYGDRLRPAMNAATSSPCRCATAHRCCHVVLGLAEPAHRLLERAPRGLPGRPEDRLCTARCRRWPLPRVAMPRGPTSRGRPADQGRGGLSSGRHTPKQRTPRSSLTRVCVARGGRPRRRRRPRRRAGRGAADGWCLGPGGPPEEQSGGQLCSSRLASSVLGFHHHDSGVRQKSGLARCCGTRGLSPSPNATSPVGRAQPV